jgi:hypothetical protein
MTSKKGQDISSKEKPKKDEIRRKSKKWWLSSSHMFVVTAETFLFLKTLPYGEQSCLPVIQIAPSLIRYLCCVVYVPFKYIYSLLIFSEHLSKIFEKCNSIKPKINRKK